MSKDARNDSPRYVGLLECPLRRGYIEFEYTSGDTAAELKHQVLETWGIAFPDNKRLAGGLLAGSRFIDPSRAWSILAEDQDGAYMPLNDADTIPLAPPPGSSFKRRDLVDEYQEQIRSRPLRPGWDPIPPGVIFEVEEVLERARFDALGPRWDTESKDLEVLLEQSLPRKDFRLILRVTREGYKVPKKHYSVRLVALATVTGG